MKPASALLLPAFILLQTDSCDRKEAPPPPAPKHYVRRIEHRFENVSPTGALGVALDTMTGQWCRTWEWQYKNNAQSGSLDTLPTCYQLFQDEPAEIEAK
jgi:hypothetical protein